MTDSTADVREALSRIVADEPDDAVDPATLDAIWRAGSRRRWRARAGVGATLAMVAILVAGALVPLRAPSAAVPGTPSGAPLASYPEHVAMPLRPSETSTPGLTALAVPGTRGTRSGVYAVGPDGSVAFVPLGGASDIFPLGGPPGAALAVSPDGRWLATTSALLDLATGARVGVALDRSADPAEQWRGAPWWSPDSHRVLYPAVPSLAGSEGLVVDVRGTTQVVPPAGVGDALLLAGWTDDETVIGIWRRSVDEFTMLTWRLGDTGWTDGATVSWPGWQDDPQAAASVSPDGSRLLLLRSVDRSESGANPGTEAQVFDTSTGALVGFPVGDVPASEAGWTQGSFLSWEGFGCRPAWRGDVPVITDGGVRLANGPAGDELVSISSAFGHGRLPGLRRERAAGRPGAQPRQPCGWSGCGPGACRWACWSSPALAVWWFGRRQNWREHPKPLPAIFPTFGR